MGDCAALREKSRKKTSHSELCRPTPFVVTQLKSTARATVARSSTTLASTSAALMEREPRMGSVVFLKRLATKTTKSAALQTKSLRKTQSQATQSAVFQTRSTPTDTVVLRVSTMNRVSAAKQVSLEEEESAAKKRINSTQKRSAVT